MHIDTSARHKWIAAAFASDGLRTAEMRDALRVSDELVDELLACELYVVGLPMYNFSVPAVFKGYIDQIVRVGRTFSFDPEQPEPYKGLIEGKTIDGTDPMALNCGSSTKRAYSIALIRSFKVWWRGFGAGFPFINLLTLTHAETDLTENSITSWDREGGFVVTRAKIGIPRLVIATICLGVFFVLGAVGTFVSLAQ